MSLDYLTFEDLDDETKNELIDEGEKKLKWAESHMPVLKAIGEEISSNGKLKGRKIAMALHTEAKTGVLALTLAGAGADVRLTSCNPLSTDDPVAYSLNFQKVEPGSLEVRARYKESEEDYYRALNWAIYMKPYIIIDDGGDLMKLLHTDRRENLEYVLGGCEETTTGIIRLKALQAEGKLEFPMMNVNDCQMKHFFDNRYGTGQSTLDGIMTATNLSIAGSRCVVAGYGWCGRGIAMRLKGMGGNVTVTEINPVKAVEAAMDGFLIAKMEDACKNANLIITATGCKDVIHEKIMDYLPNQCIIANSGHFDNEINVKYLNDKCDRSFEARKDVMNFIFGDRTIHLLSEGRLVNLASGQGHPVEIMDMSFAIQASGAEFIAFKGKELLNEVIDFPENLDCKIAELKLRSIDYKIDDLTEDQIKYLSTWEEGT